MVLSYVGIDWHYLFLEFPPHSPQGGGVPHPKVSFWTNWPILIKFGTNGPIICGNQLALPKNGGVRGVRKKNYMFTSRSISTKRQFWVGDPPPSEGNGEEIPKIDNASRFLHMRGPFVPNFIKIGQLVQKDTFGWGPSPLRGEWGGYSKNK